MRGITRMTLPALVVAGLTIMMARPASAAVPTNDDFANATVITELPFTEARVNTAEATTQATDPTGCISAAHSVWYTYTSDRDGTMSFDTFGSSFDTVLSAYTGTEGSLTQVACNDDSSGFLQSQITFDITAGTTYHIMVAGCCRTEDGVSGDLVVSASGTGDPPVPFTFDVSFSSGSVDPRTHEATVSGTVVCSESGVVEIAGVLRQRLVSGDFSVEVACSQDVSTFTAPASALGGAYTPGPAAIVDVVISGCGATDCDSESLPGEVLTLKLHPGDVTILKLRR
jgi:hypothetical protein